MTPWDERDAQTAKAIRREIDKAADNRARCGYGAGTFEDSCLRYEIMGMVKALQLIDPNANELWPKS